MRARLFTVGPLCLVALALGLHPAGGQQGPPMGTRLVEQACGSSCSSRSYPCRKGRGCACDAAELCR